MTPAHFRFRVFDYDNYRLTLSQVNMRYQGKSVGLVSKTDNIGYIRSVRHDDETDAYIASVYWISPKIEIKESPLNRLFDLNDYVYHCESEVTRTTTRLKTFKDRLDSVKRITP